jgi:hypothetical protein
MFTVVVLVLVSPSSLYLYVEGEGPETFQPHVRDTVKDFLASPSSATEDRPFAAAESVRKLVNRMDCCRALFGTRTARAVMLLLSQPGNELGRAVADLYRMNCQGRSNPSAPHQVSLLASVADNLDCLYLPFREFSVRTPPQNDTSPRRQKRRYGEYESNEQNDVLRLTVGTHKTTLRDLVLLYQRQCLVYDDVAPKAFGTLPKVPNIKLTHHFSHCRSNPVPSLHDIKRLRS